MRKKYISVLKVISKKIQKMLRNIKNIAGSNIDFIYNMKVISGCNYVASVTKKRKCKIESFR